MNPRYARVAGRAGHRCEYCRAPEAIFNLAASFQIVEEGPEHQEPFPDVPEPESVPTFQARMEERRREGEAVAEWAVFRRGWRLGVRRRGRSVVGSSGW